jgi:hypothetical protein
MLHDYTEKHQNRPPGAKYMLLIVLLILSHDSLFCANIHTVMLGNVSSWYSDRTLGQISLGSLVVVFVIKLLQVALLVSFSRRNKHQCKHVPNHKHTYIHACMHAYLLSYLLACTNMYTTRKHYRKHEIVRIHMHAHKHKRTNKRTLSILHHTSETQTRP